MKSFKEILQKDGPVVGMFLEMADPSLVEMAKWAGYDFIRVDNEHICYDFSELKEIVRVAALIDLPCQVRVNDINDITKILDAGATGIVVPDVNTVERAKAAVMATKYAPIGNRGMYPNEYPVGRHIRSIGCENFAEYFKKANDYVTLTIQIESIEAMPHLDEIIGMEGVDMISCGRGDMSQTIGKGGQVTDPEVLAIEEHVLKTTLRLGKQTILMSRSNQHLMSRYNMGGKVFVTGTDQVLLAKAFKDHLNMMLGK